MDSQQHQHHFSGMQFGSGGVGAPLPAGSSSGDVLGPSGSSVVPPSYFRAEMHQQQHQQQQQQQHQQQQHAFPTTILPGGQGSHAAVAPPSQYVAAAPNYYVPAAQQQPGHSFGAFSIEGSVVSAGMQQQQQQPFLFQQQAPHPFISSYGGSSIPVAFSAAAVSQQLQRPGGYQLNSPTRSLQQQQLGGRAMTPTTASPVGRLGSPPAPATPPPRAASSMRLQHTRSGQHNSSTNSGKNTNSMRKAGAGKGGGSSVAPSSQSQSQVNLQKGTGKPYEESPVPLDYSKKQLIVNFVSQIVTDDEFRDIFAQFGPLSATRIIYDKQSHRSKGFGFVYFVSGEDGAMAVQKLNGFEVYGKCMKVSYAEPQRPLEEVTNEQEQDAGFGGPSSLAVLPEHVEGVRVIADSSDDEEQENDNTA